MDELSLKRNFSYAFAAQGVALAVGCLTNLILPRVLGAEDFSWWQLFTFYATYIPCLALGLNDGVYLRYGGRDKSQLDPAALRSQFWVGAAFQLVLAAAVQARGETDVYSRSLIWSKGAYLAGQCLLLGVGAAGVFDLMALYIGATGLGLVCLWVKIRDEFRGAELRFALGAAECRRSAAAGLSLMLSNLCAMLVLGVGRQVVDLRWGVLAFGQVSFSLTLINFGLTFLSQVSMVLFPALRRVPEDQQAVYCRRLEDGLYLLLPWIYVLALPGRALLEWWLPEYREALAWLPLVLPICYFDCKMNLLGNTFLKVLNRQTQLLTINVCTILVSLALAAAGAWVLNSMTWVVLGMAGSIALRSLWAGRVLRRALHLPGRGQDGQDLLLAAVFLAASLLLPWGWVMALMALLAAGRAAAFRLKRKQ